MMPGRSPSRIDLESEETMSRESRLTAGVLLVVIPTVMYGGLTLLSLLTGRAAGIADNPLRHDLWRAGHAHAGVYLVLSLVMLRYVDEAALSPFWKWLARTGAPIAAILIPAAFFLSVASPAATPKATSKPSPSFTPTSPSKSPRTTSAARPQSNRS